MRNRKWRPVDESEMISHYRLAKYLFVVGVAVLIILNLYTFLVAYPETHTLTPGINAMGTVLAKDFSAYYIGAWRLWNNPAQIYTLGALHGAEPAITPSPEAYKYLPSFLVIVSPFLSLNYQHALTAFDIFQFLLLPLMAFMLYELLGKKGLAITFVVMAIALLLPFPAPNGGFLVELLLAMGRRTSQSPWHLPAAPQLLLGLPRKTLLIRGSLGVWFL